MWVVVVGGSGCGFEFDLILGLWFGFEIVIWFWVCFCL